MKKFKTLALSLMMLGAFSLTAFADESVNVFVTISDDNGEIVMTQEQVTVTDIDDDGALTINDALYAAHEAKFEGGASAGYESGESQWGLSLNKLWGVANGGSYGYYVNNQSAMGLTDEVEDGDYINAFIYTDLIAWSDTYCYFNANTISVEKNEEVTLTLMAAGYDESYNPIVVPVEGATITVNGEATEYKTDAEGKVIIKISEVGNYVISASSDNQILVPPVCLATVAEAEMKDETIVTTPDTGDKLNTWMFIAIAMASVAYMAVCAIERKNNYEK